MQQILLPFPLSQYAGSAASDAKSLANSLGQPNASAQHLMTVLSVDSEPEAMDRKE